VYPFKFLISIFFSMDDRADDFEKQVTSTRFNIKLMMERIQIQLGVQKRAMETCDVFISDHQYEECAGALQSAIIESAKYVEYNAELVILINELNRLISKKILEKS